MDNDTVQLIGGPCGQHGPYTFYKAFKYTKDGIKRIMTLSEFFFVKLWMDSDLVCIGELQLLWIDKNSEQVLASLRLYFLPENTPEGRMDHGEDEVLAISEKVVLRVEDLITWITLDAEWTWGKLGKICIQDANEDEIRHFLSFSESSLDFSDVEKERKSLEICNDSGTSVIILSYPKYCRYRSVMKRLEGVENQFLRHKLVNALGGFSVPTCNTRILFCRDTFDYPELEGHELLCNHLAPKLKGRPRGRRKKRSTSPGSESNESECSISIVASTSTGKLSNEDCINGFRKDYSTISTRRSTRSSDGTDSKMFLKKLSSFMKSNHTPIGRIPLLGYKELDLHAFYTKVQKCGGYDMVTANRLWKSIFDDLGGNHGSTSAATVIRRHYERFLLPYERYVKGEEYKPLPVSERRRLKSKASRNSVSDAETSEGTSGSDTSTSMPQPIFPSTSQASFITYGTTENKDSPDKVKTSSLRSVRVKPERLRDAAKLKVDTLFKDTTTENISVSIANEIKEEVCEKSTLLVLPDRKDNEPTTSAATPIQKMETEETLSPIESKEIPTPEMKEDPEKEIEIIEIPPTDEVHKDIIKLDSTDVYKTVSSINSSTISETVITEVKKQKLDILKQGGLEVTPVRNITATKVEFRPSVIQTAITQRAEIIPKDVNMDDKKQMPPPQMATLTKRTMQVQPIIPTVQTTVTSKSSIHINKGFSYSSQSPPKVLQSKSIYSPSGETVYGDPKDIFQPTIQNIQSPKFLENPRQQTGGGILDLTVKSPQKPTTQLSCHVPPYHHTPRTNLVIPSPLSLLDNRKVSSNLEITLVGSRKNIKNPNVANNSFSRYMPKQRGSYNPSSLTPQGYKISQKRSYTENVSHTKLPKVDDKIRNTIYSTQMYPPRELKKNDFDPTINKQYKIDNTSTKNPIPSQPAGKQPFMPPSSMFNMPSYISSVAKSVPPFLHMDPSLYYLQSMYSPLGLPPMPLMPSPDSLQLYTEILSHNSRSRMQFPFSQENSSMASTTNSKK